MHSYDLKSTKTVTSLKLIRSFELLGANYEVGVGREKLVYTAEVPTDQVKI
jgi:predicted Zn-dependent peptidase